MGACRNEFWNLKSFETRLKHVHFPHPHTNIIVLFISLNIDVNTSNGMLDWVSKEIFASHI